MRDFINLKGSPPKRSRDASADGQPHYWRIQFYERYVSRGVCDCGAVKFFANNESKLALQRAAEFNRKKGKKGSGHNDSPEDKEEIVPKEEEHLPPVPPRPDTSGMNTWRRNMATHAYFEANREAILHDLDTLGEKAMQKRWNISQATWGSGEGRNGLRNRWRPEDYGAPLTRTKKAASPKAPKAEPRTTAKTPAPEPTPEPEEDTTVGEKVTVYCCAHCPARFEDRGELMNHLELHGTPLPAFPEFDPKWKKEVQVEWLRAYAKMAARQRGNYEPN